MGKAKKTNDITEMIRMINESRQNRETISRISLENIDYRQEIENKDKRIKELEGNKCKWEEYEESKKYMNTEMIKDLEEEYSRTKEFKFVISTIEEYSHEEIEAFANGFKIAESTKDSGMELDFVFKNGRIYDYSESKFKK